MIIDRHAQLKALHLHGMAAVWQEWQVEGNTRQKPVMSEIWLDRLIAAEQADRKARSAELPITYRQVSTSSRFDSF